VLSSDAGCSLILVSLFFSILILRELTIRFSGNRNYWYGECMHFADFLQRVMFPPPPTADHESKIRSYHMRTAISYWANLY